MKRATLGACLALMVLAGIGCQGAPKTKGTQLLIEPGEAQKLGYVTQWATDLKTPAQQKLAYAAVLGDLVVTVETPSNIVSAVSLRDGRLMWREVVGHPLDHLFQPARSGNTILVNTENTLYHLSAVTGEVERMDELIASVNMGPTVSETFAFYGAQTGRFFAHDLKTGYPRWEFQLHAAIFAQPTLSGLNVFVADGIGRYVLLDAASGKALWEGRTFGRVSAQPLATNVGIYIPSEDGTLYGLNRATGKDRWLYRTTQRLTESPVAFGNTIYLPIRNESLIALDEATGKELWKSATGGKPVVQRGSQLWMSHMSQILVLDTQTGQPVADATVQPLKTILPGPDNSLILVSPQGRLLRMDAR